MIDGALCGSLRRAWDPTGAVPGSLDVGFAFVPGVAAVANAISAAALTRLLGAYADATCREGAAPPMPYPMPIAMARAAKTEGAPPVSGGELDISIDVTVTFTLK